MEEEGFNFFFFIEVLLYVYFGKISRILFFCVSGVCMCVCIRGGERERGERMFRNRK